MRRIAAFIIAIVAWFAVVEQFNIMLDNRILPVGETIIRFFSYFTILTNTIVALYFTLDAFKPRRFRAGVLTAITVYIFIVGIVYQVMLRHVWQPVGIQKLVDELLHTVNPVLTILFWIRFEAHQEVRNKQIPYWLVYPVFYFIYTFVRGAITGFYPYPFIDVTQLGLQTALFNGVLVFIFFALMCFLFVFIGKKIK